MDQKDYSLFNGTRRLHKAAEKIPGIGVRINGPLALKLIQTMQAKHESQRERRSLVQQISATNTWTMGAN